jgi:hypothetical protein
VPLKKIKLLNILHSELSQEMVWEYVKRINTGRITKQTSPYQPRGWMKVNRTSNDETGEKYDNIIHHLVYYLIGRIRWILKRKPRNEENVSKVEIGN